MVKMSSKRSLAMGLLVCVIAAGAGTYAGIKDKVGGNVGDYSRVTVEWSTQPAAEEGVNAPVTNVPDERRTQPEATTAKAYLPYTGSFALPMGENILKDYSGGEMVFSKTMGDWRVHSGVDFAGAQGSKVLAVAPGKVTKVYTDSFLGVVAEVDHGNEMTVRYCGLNADSVVRQGAEVDKFELIGTLGIIPSELSDTAHLHLEVIVDGVTVDPLKALNKVDM